MGITKKFLRDRFTFSLSGGTAVASFFITPVIADDTINKAWDQKLRHKAQERPDSVEHSGAARPLPHGSLGGSLG